MLSAMAPHVTRPEKENNFFTQGDGYKKISKSLLISQNTVAKVVQTFKKDGTSTISQRRPGRPRKLTPRQERLLMRRVEENRHASSLQLSKEVESQTGVTISRDTIRRTLQRNGMHGCRPRKKPLLKPRHKKARLEFARAHADKDEDYWSGLLYTLVWWDQDKCFLELMASKLYGVAKVRNTKKNAWCLQWNMVVAVSLCGAAWVLLVSGSCISLMASWIHKCTALYWKRRCYHHSVPLVVVHFSNMSMILNTSKATVGFLKKNRVKVIQWPSMSADLNPIEHLWGILKTQVEHHSPFSIQSLKEVILEEWKKIDLAKCRQLVHSMPRRLGAVIKNHGGHTKY